ncbi:MAG TPA: cytochrome d ubiquinol oxidase subunit II [Longimicrobiales bacterium]|jgi:cytochrome d ubiquinol oxidase subunit II
MTTVWFILVAFLLTGYVILDGFDLGAGILHGLVGRTEEERGRVLASIGPVWDGNEVWLIAAGGTLYMAFPVLYAASFSGFYLPLIVILWLLMLRGVSIEFRGHVSDRLWVRFWDVVFSGSSALLALFFGAALGNVVRGVSLSPERWFFAPLWTDFGVGGGPPGILDWYTVLVGLLAVGALGLHGALWVALKTDGELGARALRSGRVAWWAVAALTLVVTLATFRVQPLLATNLAERPWGSAFPLLAVGGLVGVGAYLRREPSPGVERRAFLASCAYLAGMMASAAFGIFPYVLPSWPQAGMGLTAAEAAASSYSLGAALVWWPIAMALTLFYFVRLYRSFGGKVRVGAGGH